MAFGRCNTGVEHSTDGGACVGSFHFQADSPEEAQNWITAITEARAQLRDCLRKETQLTPLQVCIIFEQFLTFFTKMESTPGPRPDGVLSHYPSRRSRGVVRARSSTTATISGSSQLSSFPTSSVPRYPEDTVGCYGHQAVTRRCPFAVNVVDSEMTGPAFNAERQKVLTTIDHVYTALYTVELSFNLYANLTRSFVHFFYILEGFFWFVFVSCRCSTLSFLGSGTGLRSSLARAGTGSTSSLSSCRWSRPVSSVDQNQNARMNSASAAGVCSRRCVRAGG